MSCFVYLVFEKRSHCVGQSGFELVTVCLSLQSALDFRGMPLHHLWEYVYPTPPLNYIPGPFHDSFYYILLYSTHNQCILCVLRVSLSMVLCIRKNHIELDGFVLTHSL